MSEFREIFDRLKEYFGLSSDKDVADRIGLNQETMKSWSTRKKVVVKTLMEKMKDEPINFNWLFNGIGMPKISEADLLLSDISRMERAINCRLDAKLIEKISGNEKLVELVMLLPYAPGYLVDSLISRLKEIKRLSEI
jgi:hypothetical protein